MKNNHFTIKNKTLNLKRNKSNKDIKIYYLLKKRFFRFTISFYNLQYHYNHGYFLVVYYINR